MADEKIFSNIEIQIDDQHRLLSFTFSRLPCGQEVSFSGNSYTYYLSRKIDEILSISFGEIISDLNISDEEEQFNAYVEWDALRSAIAQYLGSKREDVDDNRCTIESIEHHEKGTRFAGIILPPKELTEIIV